jgi:hypothetical protein
MSIRAALGVGLLYGVPFTLWIFSQATPGPLPSDLSAAVPALAGAQALVLLLVLPANNRPEVTAATPVELLIATALVIMVPWPVLVLVLATGSTTLGDLAWTQAAVALWGVLLVVLVLANRWLPLSVRSAAVGLGRGLALLVLLYLFHLYLRLAAGGVPTDGVGP